MVETRKYETHGDLVARMAEVQGIDLDEAVLRGQIDPEQLHDVVLSCTGCTDPENCQHWLEGHGKGRGGTPDYCRNADLMARLRAAQC